jgi:hypothetical protein
MGLLTIKEITETSNYIYSDASDYGTPTKAGDRIWKMAQSLVKNYAIVGSRKTFRYSTGSTVTARVKVQGKIYEVTFNTCTDGLCQGYDGYVYIAKVK